MITNENVTYMEFISLVIAERGCFGIDDNQYYETHHIIPRCMNGSNEKCNLIRLYAQEHYIAHKLLAQEYPNHYGLQMAWNTFCYGRDKCKKEKIYISADDYAEMKKNLSAVCSQRQKDSQINKKPVICIETGQWFRSIRAAMDFLHRTGAVSNIVKCCRDNTKTAYGYHWKYANDDEYEATNYYSKPFQYKKIICIETGKIYNSIADVKKEFLENPYGIRHIYNSLRNVTKTTCGLHWQVYNEFFDMNYCLGLINKKKKKIKG